MRMGFHEMQRPLTDGRCCSKIRQRHRGIEKELRERRSSERGYDSDVPCRAQINGGQNEISAQQHPADAVVHLLGNCAGENRGCRRNVKADDLEQNEAEGRQERMRQVRREQAQEDQALDQREKIARQEAVKNDLPLCKRTGEQEFDVRRLEHQSALQKAFKKRTAQHDQCASDQTLPANQLPEHLLAAIVEQKADEA